uniref:Uncharacterized protein n=1 Tax=Arundo donax TaxID=35708 RepID=A0A0A9A7G5_ARUDO
MLARSKQDVICSAIPAPEVLPIPLDYLNLKAITQKFHKINKSSLV